MGLDVRTLFVLLALLLAPVFAADHGAHLQTSAQWQAAAVTDGTLTTWWISDAVKIEIASKRALGESDADFLHRHEVMVARGMLAFPQEWGTFITTEWEGAHAWTVATETILGHWEDVEFWFEIDPSAPSVMRQALEFAL